jgi:hypothetical protein
MCSVAVWHCVRAELLLELQELLLELLEFSSVELQNSRNSKKL